MNNKLFFVIFFILCVVKSFAQDNYACLTKHQLFKMQSSSLADIRMFLSNESWSFDGAKSNQSYSYFDYPINYNIVSWEKSRENIILYNSTGKPSIVIYQSSASCFNDLLNSFTSTKSKTIVDEDKLTTIFKEYSATVEFREYINDDSRKQYSILVYNSNALFKELQTLKEKEYALKMVTEEKIKKYNNALAEGDTLFSFNKFKDAKLKYLTASKIENNLLIQSRIDQCDNAICETIISKGDSLYNANQYQKAIRVFTDAKDCSKSLILLTEKIDLCEKAICETIISKGDSLYNANQYEKAIRIFTDAKVCSKSLLLLTEKIDLCEKAICEILVSKGDSLFNANQFEKALRVFKDTKDCSKLLLSLDEKIQSTERKILDDKINSIQNKAEEYFKDKKYDLVLEKYNTILLLDKSNSNASQRIKDIQEIKNILEKRGKTLFSYKSTNKNDFIKFQNILLEDIQLQINKFSEGFLNLNYFISFDTLGNNISSIKNISTSLTDYKTNLSIITSNDVLKPSSEGGFFLASKENLTFDVKWSTNKNLFISNSKGIFQNEYTNQNHNSIESFIKKQPFEYGKYTFEIKNTKFNEISYSNINLVKYRTAGPEAALLSMLMPGVGTLKVTHGQEGWNRFTWFLISSGLAIGSKLYSDAKYKSYLGATNQADIKRYYANANINHKISLISRGISASIYLHDIIWVISKGAKNLKSSKPLRMQLQQGPIQIQFQNQLVSRP